MLLQGKKALILGLANNKSIAYGIAHAFKEQGARLAFNYVGDAIKKRVEPLSEELGGEFTFQCDVTDDAQIQAAADLVKEKWGGTAAYQEYQQREENGSAGDSAELMAQFAELGKLKNLAPAAPEVQNAICKLQQFITDHFYTCTSKILAGLGEMYVADERFRENIDKAGGEGTAAFVSKAIAVYCGK